MSQQKVHLNLRSVEVMLFRPPPPFVNLRDFVTLNLRLLLETVEWTEVLESTDEPFAPLSRLVTEAGPG